MASALYCVWIHLDDYRRAVLTAVNTDGDSDSIAAITGSIMGARLGIDEIPRRWREEVENSHKLLELGQQLPRAAPAFSSHLVPHQNPYACEIIELSALNAGVFSNAQDL